MSEYDNARFKWRGKPNPYPKGTGPWKRTEIARKLSGKTVGELIAATKRSTPDTLAYGRLIEIEGYQGRATESEMEERRDALYAIVAEQQPMTVRGAYYQAEVRGLVGKEEKGYGTVQRALVDMRRKGILPWEWIVDNSRGAQQPYTYTSAAQALQDTADTYRKRLWTNKDPCVQVWMEKDALAGTIIQITRQYDVPLYVSRGFSSITLLRDAAESMPFDRRSYIYHMGDYDKAGVDAAKNIEKDLRGFAEEIHPERTGKINFASSRNRVGNF